MEKPLYIPENKRVTGLTVYCPHKGCDTNVSKECKLTGKPLQQCPNGHKLYFKVYIHQPGTKNKRWTKKLKTRNLEEARIEALRIHRELMQQEPETKQTEVAPLQRSAVSQHIPLILTHAMAKHISWLKGDESVPAHKRRERSSSYTAEVERAYKFLLDCLRKNNHEIEEITLNDLTDTIVGDVYTYLLEDKKFSPRTFNKHISYYSSLIRHINKEYRTSIPNYFETVNRKPVVNNPEAITKEEFDQLLSQITPENGEKHYKGEQQPRSLHRYYLKNAYRLFLHSGRRTEEVIQMRFSDILEENNTLYMKVPDLKVNRIKGIKTPAQMKYILVPVTRDLQEVLNDLGFTDEKVRGSNNYLIAPEIEQDRKRIMYDVLSRAFTYYFDQISDRKLTLKCLRKTYISAAHLYTKGEAKILSGHNGDAVITKHYVSEKVTAAAAAKDFEVFPSQDRRRKELEELRNETSIKQKEMEVHK